MKHFLYCEKCNKNTSQTTRDTTKHAAKDKAARSGRYLRSNFICDTCGDRMFYRGSGSAGKLNWLSRKDVATPVESLSKSQIKIEGKTK